MKKIKSKFFMSLLLACVMFFTISLSGCVGSFINRKREKAYAFVKEFMETVPIEKEGFSIGCEANDTSIPLERAEGTYTVYGKTVNVEQKNEDFYLTIGDDEDKKTICINKDFLKERSKAFVKISYMWCHYINEKYSPSGSPRSGGEIVNGVNAITIYEDYIFVITFHYQKAWCDIGEGHIPTCLFSYDLLTDEVFYLGYNPESIGSQTIKSNTITLPEEKNEKDKK